MNIKYTYKSATGDIEIEVDEKWAAVLAAEDEAERKAERCHSRPDHKYAPGSPVSINGTKNEIERLADINDLICVAMLSVDLYQALHTLTRFQRRYFVLSRVKGYSYAEIAELDGKNEAAIRKHIRLATAALKNFLS